MVPRLLSPHFKIKKISAIDLTDIYSLCECIASYIKEGEWEENVEMHQVLSEIHTHIDNKGGVWFLYKGKEVVGFLAGSLITTRYGKQHCFVDYLFVEKEARMQGYARRLAEIGIAWVKQQNIKKIMCVTGRHAKAMCRFLPGKWKVESTVIGLCW